MSSGITVDKSRGIQEMRQIEKEQTQYDYI